MFSYFLMSKSEMEKYWRRVEVTLSALVRLLLLSSNTYIYSIQPYNVASPVLQYFCISESFLGAFLSLVFCK